MFVVFLIGFSHVGFVVVVVVLGGGFLFLISTYCSFNISHVIHFVI